MFIFGWTIALIFLSGYTEVMPWQGIAQEEALPVCERGDMFTVDEIKLLEKQTNPPDYLTEAELITLMEKHGIGMTIHAHIWNRSCWKEAHNKKTNLDMRSHTFI